MKNRRRTKIKVISDPSENPESTKELLNFLSYPLIYATCSAMYGYAVPFFMPVISCLEYHELMSFLNMSEASRVEQSTFFAATFAGIGVVSGSIAAYCYRPNTISHF